MIVEASESYVIRSGDDVVRTRQQVRAVAVKIGLSLVDQTKIVTASSEIARNTLDYGGGGDVALEQLRDGTRLGLRLVFTDEGPGIADIERALTDKFTTGNGLGLGLGGARRLVNEFAIESEPGKGTRVTLVRWAVR